MIALFIAAMGFAQMKVQGQLSSQAFKKKVSVEKTHGQLMSQPFKKAVKVSTTTRAVTGTLQNYGTTAQGNAIGTNSAGTLGAAALFETTDLTSYVGQYITKISAGIANASVVTSGKVAIMTGTADAPVVVYEQACTFTTGVNEVVLSTPYQIPSGTAIMVGYEIVVTGGYPIACDDGPAVENGDLICIGELGDAFDHMADYGLDYNNVISATVEDDPSSPLLTVAPNSMVFVGFVGDAATEAQAATLSTRSISSNINIATAAPFEVSTDNTTFGASATMAGEGTFYVRYIPATEESTAVVTGTVTVSATGADDATIAINAITFDCTSAITTLPYEEGFESGIPCWTYFSNNTENGLGVNQLSETNYAFVFSSYDEAENGDYNQYLITPELGFTEDVLLSFDYAGTSPYSEGETFAVLASSTTNDIAAFSTNLSGEIVATNVYTDGFETYLVTVPAGTKYIAINYYSDYQYRLLIDNFSLRAVPTAPEIALTSVTPTSGLTVQTNTNIHIGGVVANNGIDVTSYKVSYTVDGGAAVEYNVTGINVELGGTDEFTHATPVVLETAGEHTIVVTVSEPNGVADGDDSDNSLTITLNAISCDPISTFPYEEGFEDGIPQCWTIIDADGDGHNWMTITDLMSEDPTEYVHGGANAAISQSFINNVGELDADNWLISQAIELPSEGAYLASWYATSLDAGYPDSYSVYIGTEPTVDNMTANPAVLSLTADEGDWTMKTIDLTSFAGQTIYIGFNHVDYDNYVLMIDDFSIFAAPTDPEIELTSISIEDGATIIAGETITLTGVVTNNGVALTSYKVAYSVDGGAAVEYNVTEINVNLGGTDEFIHATPISLEAGEHTIAVTVSNPNGEADGDDSDNTITVDVTVIDCDAITVPYTQDFENDITACWGTISNNEANNVESGEMGIYDLNGNKVFRFSSNSSAENSDYNQYLITPMITLTEDAVLSFVYSKSNSSNETFRVMTSTTDRNIASFTAISEDITITSTEFTTFTATIPANTKYVAINYFSQWKYYMYIDNLSLSAVPTTPEIALTSVTPATGTTVHTGEGINISGVVTNNGAALTSYKVAYTVDGGEAVEQTVNGINVALAETHNFTFETPAVVETAGNHTIVVTVSNPNGEEDGDDSDNSITFTVNAIDCSTVHSAPFEETFADDSETIECWTIIDANEDGSTFSISSDRAAYRYNSSNAANDWLISPKLSIAENNEISFEVANAGNSYPETYKVWAITESPSNYSNATLLQDATQPGSTTLTAVTISLANYAGQEIYIGIQCVSDANMFYLYVDNFELRVATSAEENIAEAIEVYPNPTSSMVTIANAEGKDIVVVNSLGQVVASIENAAANQTIDVTNFANGTYFVKVDAEVVKLNVVK